MQVAEVMEVADLEAARLLCQADGADACLVAVEDVVPDGKTHEPANAPGCAYGVPSLMIVPAVTPHWRKIARRAGYAAVMPASIANRMFYRRIGAALQRRRAAHRGRNRRLGMATPPFYRSNLAEQAKPTLH